MEINIKTKFNVGDTAFTFSHSTQKLEEVQVEAISVHVAEKPYLYYFTAGSEICITEDRLFASREEFIAQL